MRLSTIIGLVVCLGILVGCESEPKTPEPTVFYYQNAKPILDSKCNTCHFSGGVAPFTLDTYAQASKMKDAIFVALAQGTMPPWLADESCNEYDGNGSLTKNEKTTLLDWTSQGGAEGDSTNEGAPVENPASLIKLSRSDLNLSMSESYTPKKTPDDYRCFLLDWEGLENTGYVTGFKANPGNLSIAHHVIAYLIPESEVETIQALDAADSDYGYECFGGPGTMGLFQWLGAWAPGGKGADFPTDTGIKITKGSKIVLQLHYNMFDTAPEPDKTSIDIKIDSEVAHEASILLWLDFRGWLAEDNMKIPAGESSVSHYYVQDPTLFIDRLTSDLFSPGESFRIHWVALHQHELGTHSKIWVKSGEEEKCLVEIPQWDFNWQFPYELRQPIVFNSGDTLHLSCTWDNSSSNQRRVNGVLVDPQDVSWGDGTQDEMCLGVLYISKL